MAYLLDTNVWVVLLRGRDRGVAARLKALPPADVSVCSIVLAELLVGTERSADARANAAAVRTLLGPYPSLPFDDHAAEHYARIRSVLDKAGNGIGGNDYLIAAIALAHDLTLVTHNTREFARVPGLRLEDWQAPPQPPAPPPPAAPAPNP